jgi:hypothetical protein
METAAVLLLLIAIFGVVTILALRMMNDDDL